MMKATRWGTAVIAAALALAAAAADRTPRGKPDRPVGITASRPLVPFDAHAMNAMLRADRDKDGVLSREELEQYDLALARRFKDVDADRDGKLTLYEFEKLLEPPQASARR